jgi:hypothetical protein
MVWCAVGQDIVAVFVQGLVMCDHFFVCWMLWL